MLPATKTHIVGMLNIVRQCCLSVEAAMASDSALPPKAVRSGSNSADDLPLDEDRYCTEKEEDMVAQLMGLEPPPPQKPAPKGRVNGN